MFFSKEFIATVIATSVGVLLVAVVAKPVLDKLQSGIGTVDNIA